MKKGQQMKFEECSKMIQTELREAGFDVSEYKGFPLIKMPATHTERIRLLEFQTSFLCNRQIFFEGMLFVPIPKGQNAGSWAMRLMIERRHNDERHTNNTG